MSNLINKTGLTKEQLDRMQYDLGRKDISNFHQSQGINVPMSNALSMAIFNQGQRVKLKKEKRKKLFDNIKQFAMDEMINKIPLSGLVKSVVKMPTANDAIDSIISMGGSLVDSAATKLFGKKRMRYQPDVPASDFIQPLPTEYGMGGAVGDGGSFNQSPPSTGFTAPAHFATHYEEREKYAGGGYVDRKMYDDGGDVEEESVVQEDGYRGDWRDKQIIEDFQNRHQRNALYEAMQKRYHDLKYGNITGTEAPGKWEMAQSQKELDSFNMINRLDKKIERMEDINTRRTMGGNMWPDSHYRNQMPQYYGGGKYLGPSHEEGGIPIEVDGGEYVIPAGYNPKYEPILEAMRKETLQSRLQKLNPLPSGGTFVGRRTH